MKQDLISTALKEWDLLITALLEGRQAILLRKGGILESENQFELEHERFLFYPTFVHQDPKMVKPQFCDAIRREAAEPEMLTIRGYGEVAKIFEVPSRPKLEMQDDLHVWDAPLLDMRFAYRPEKPLYLVVIRAFVLEKAATIRNTLAYAGCKSWVPLVEGVDVSGAKLAMPEDGLQGIVERITDAFQA